MRSISITQQNQIEQSQQLLINLAMKQAFFALQLPILELSDWMKSEIESNPVLEIDPSEEERHHSRPRAQEALERRRKEHQESLLTAPASLYAHLMQQIPLVLEDPHDLVIAEQIIGHLNEKGYLDQPLQDIVPGAPLHILQNNLETIQGLDPPGIGASNLQECLLLQLKIKHKQHGLAAKIITDHFEDLLHNRFPQIAQALHLSLEALSQIIKREISPLDLHPGYRYSFQPAVAIVPDLIFHTVDEKWQIEVNTSCLPRFHISPLYREALREENPEGYYLRRQLASGTWMKRIIARRNHTLRRIGEYLLKRQLCFFTGEKAGLYPLTMQEVAQELGIHESTVARAVSNKYLACPIGLFSLKTFFNQGLPMQNGQKISNFSLKEIVARTIKNEDKNKPLSDQQIAQHFQELGIPCARRTIAKYRSVLKISPASKRRKWN